MKKINYIIISALFAILPYASRLKAQTIAVKSDLLTGALSSPNLSAEEKNGLGLMVILSYAHFAVFSNTQHS